VQPNQGYFIALAVLGVLCGTAGIVCVRTYSHRIRSQRKVLEKWASQSGFELQEACYRRFFCGLFTFFSSKGQGVFRITVKDAAGGIQKGFVRVGGFTGWGDYVKVAWDRSPESDVDVPDVDDMP
jgi:hypothetical protein